jgi:hypothetical protein
MQMIAEMQERVIFKRGKFIEIKGMDYSASFLAFS